ncbi:unnamed protein product, partial [Effrenium voratum]
VFGLWRAAATGDVSGRLLRSLWPIESERPLRQLEKKLGVLRESLDLVFDFSNALQMQTRCFQTWVQKIRAQRRAEELYVACQHTSRFMYPSLCLKLWAAHSHQVLAKKRARARLVGHGGAIVEQASWGFRLGAACSAFGAWRRFAALRRAPRLESRLLLSLCSSNLDDERASKRVLSLMLGSWHQRCLRRSVMHNFQCQHLSKQGRQGLFSAMHSWRRLCVHNQALRRGALRRLGEDERLKVFMVFDYWHKHLKADLRQAEAERLAMMGTWQRWRRKQMAQRWALRTGLLRESEGAKRDFLRFRAVFGAWKRRARHGRRVTQLVGKAVGPHGLKRYAWSAWATHLLRRRRSGCGAYQRAAARLAGDQARGLLASALHGWWSGMLLRHSTRQSFHLGLRKLQRWRIAQQRFGGGRGDCALSAQILGAHEALSAEQRKHFLTARSLREWQRVVDERRTLGALQGHVGRREAALQRATGAWGSHQAQIFLHVVWRSWRRWAHECHVERLNQRFQGELRRAVQAWARGDLLFMADLEAQRRELCFLQWRRVSAEERRRVRVGKLEERLHQVSLARLALAEGLQGAQGAQLSCLFQQQVLLLWHNAARDQKEGRRQQKRQQLAASLVDGSPGA